LRKGLSSCHPRMTSLHGKFMYYRTLHHLAHTRTSTLFTHVRIQSVTKYLRRDKIKVHKWGGQAGEGEMAWTARRDTSFEATLPPVLHTSALRARVSAHRLLPTRNPSQQGRSIDKAQSIRSGEKPDDQTK
jgi:hypothetical protein